jgi:hypothetical protein
MSDYMNPPRPKGATSKDQIVIDEAHRLSFLSSDPDARYALRESVKLIVRLIDRVGINPARKMIM